jgi:molybdate transport system ATP-binding protein
MSALGLDVDVKGVVGKLPIDVGFRTGERPTVIVGPNGAGKSTVLLMILGQMRPRHGHVTLDGRRLCQAERGLHLPIEARRIGFLPQRHALFPHLDALGNAGYGLRAASRAERIEQAQAALEKLGVGHLGARRPQELSGGEAQRVALARALASRPRALLLDEPLAALDASVRADVRGFLAQHLTALALPTVIVTHDRADAEAFGGEIVVIENGAVRQRGTLADLATAPATDFARRLFSSEP